jgi:hypothetical protein
VDQACLMAKELAEYQVDFPPHHPNDCGAEKVFFDWAIGERGGRAGGHVRELMLGVFDQVYSPGLDPVN